MRLLVTGSRDFADEFPIRMMFDKLSDYHIEALIHGDCHGADRLVVKVALEIGFDKEKVKAYPADWHKYGKSAGCIRNAKMIEETNPSLVVGFPMPGSIGTWHMLDLARKYGVPLRIWEKGVFHK